MLSCKCFDKVVFYDVIIVIEHRGVVHKPVALVQTGDFPVAQGRLDIRRNRVNFGRNKFKG